MKTVEKEKLWEEYQKNPSAELREKARLETWVYLQTDLSY